MFGDGSLTLREFAMKEPLPLARVQDAVLSFLQGRDDAVLFGAQAVNVYVDEPRMTPDVNVLSTRAAALAEEIRVRLATEFHIAVRVREVANGLGFRVFQLRKPSNRHLVDVRQVNQLPARQVVERVQVPTPEVLIAMKVIACDARRGQPKGDTDLRDLKVLLLNRPELKRKGGLVDAALTDAASVASAVALWNELVAMRIVVADEDADLDY